MPKHHPPELRAHALRRLAETRCDYRAISAELDLSPVTLRSWVTRYGLPADAPGQASQREAGYAADDDAPEPANVPTLRTSAPASGVSSLVELTRTEYLRDRVDLLERIVRDMMHEERPTWSALRPLIALQSDLHREHVDVVRAEGAQLDLSSDPVAIARAIEDEARLLAVLRQVIDGESVGAD